MSRNEFRVAVAELLGADPDQLADTATRDTVEGWSSLADVQLLHLIAAETGVTAEDELLGCQSIGALLDELERRNGFRN